MGSHHHIRPTSQGWQTTATRRMAPRDSMRPEGGLIPAVPRPTAVPTSMRQTRLLTQISTVWWMRVRL